MTLPEERVPFPVEPRYSVRPTMRRWDAADRGHLRLDRTYPSYLREKLRLLRDDPDGCRVVAAGVDRDALRQALLRVAEGLAADAAPEGAAAVPAPIVAGPDALRFPLLGIALARPGLGLSSAAPVTAVEGLPRPLLERVHRHLAALEPLERLADALALAVQEDLVLMAGPEASEGGDAGAAAPGAGARDGRAELLHVCFPSSWDPAERAGAGFAALHAPVPHSEMLQAAAGRVVRAMVAKGPFVRYVWSLAEDATLDRNPRRRPAVAAPAGPAALWFRVERQTVLPLPALGRALFTIRVYRAPLPAVLTTPARRRALASALRSMDEALLAYKGVGGLRSALLAYLERP